MPVKSSSPILVQSITKNKIHKNQGKTKICPGFSPKPGHCYCETWSTFQAEQNHARHLKKQLSKPDGSSAESAVRFGKIMPESLKQRAGQSCLNCIRLQIGHYIKNISAKLRPIARSVLTVRENDIFQACSFFNIFQAFFKIFQGHATGYQAPGIDLSGGNHFKCLAILLRT